MPAALLAMLQLLVEHASATTEEPQAEGHARDATMEAAAAAATQAIVVASTAQVVQAAQEASAAAMATAAPAASQASVSSDEDQHSVLALDDESKERRANRVGLLYRCGKCGQPKKGHVCTVVDPMSAPPVTAPLIPIKPTKPRGVGPKGSYPYSCSRCGLPKKGHACLHPVPKAERVGRASGAAMAPVARTEPPPLVITWHPMTQLAGADWATLTGALQVAARVPTTAAEHSLTPEKRALLCDAASPGEFAPIAEAECAMISGSAAAEPSALNGASAVDDVDDPSGSVAAPTATTAVAPVSPGTSALTEAAAPTGWACARCTLRNESNLSRCLACGASNRLGTSRPAAHRGAFDGLSLEKRPKPSKREPSADAGAARKPKKAKGGDAALSRKRTATQTADLLTLPISSAFDTASAGGSRETAPHLPPPGGQACASVMSSPMTRWTHCFKGDASVRQAIAEGLTLVRSHTEPSGFRAVRLIESTVGQPTGAFESTVSEADGLRYAPAARWASATEQGATAPGLALQLGRFPTALEAALAFARFLGPQGSAKAAIDTLTGEQHANATTAAARAAAPGRRDGAASCASSAFADASDADEETDRREAGGREAGGREAGGREDCGREKEAGVEVPADSEEEVVVVVGEECVMVVDDAARGEVFSIELTAPPSSVPSPHQAPASTTTAAAPVCSICFDKLEPSGAFADTGSDLEVLPWMVTACGHAFHRPCLHSLAKHRGARGKGGFDCPECRELLPGSGRKVHHAALSA